MVLVLLFIEQLWSGHLLLLMRFTFVRDSCLSMLEFPGDWFMLFLFLLRRGAHLSPTAGRLWILMVETAAADCCQGFSAGSWMLYFFLASSNRILLYNLAACPPTPWLTEQHSFCEQPFDLARSVPFSCFLTRAGQPIGTCGALDKQFDKPDQEALFMLCFTFWL